MLRAKTQDQYKGKTIKVAGLALLFCLLLNHFVYAAAPTLGTISPSSGSTAPNVAITFTTTYSDTDGWANLKEAYLLVSTSSSALTNSAYLYYDQNTNKLYLRNDANSAWLGGYAPASSNTIENSYVKLACASSTVSSSAKTMTVKWNVTFKPAYSGKAYNTYLKIIDDTAGSAGWIQKGVYTVNVAPDLGTSTPSSGTGYAGTAQTFTAAYSDADGWQNIQYVYFLISTSSSALTNCSYLYYDQNTNKLYLRNDANSAWLGGFAPGTSNIIENSYAKLNCASTIVSGSANTMTVNWSVTCKNTFTGAKQTYLYVKDDVNACVNWTQKGTWTIQQADTTPPQITSVAPADGSTFKENDTVAVSPVVYDGDPSPLEYQFSVDGVVKKSWSSQANYNWVTASTDKGSHSIKTEVRDAGGQDAKQAGIYVFRKPIGPPQH